MANEIKAHLQPRHIGSATIVARLIDEAGAQQGALIPLVESVTVPALFIGDMPAAPAGFYEIRIEDGSGAIAAGCIEWDGAAELQATAADLIEIRKRIANRKKIEDFNTPTTTLITYDDDKTTELYRDTLKTFGGENVVTYPGVQTETVPE